MNIKEVWEVFKKSSINDKDMQRSFKNAVSTNACIELLEENEDLAKHIAKLEAENDRLREKVAGLEHELSKCIVGLFSERELEQRDLEQQAKGVDDFTIELLGRFRSHLTRNQVISYSGQYIELLRKQAEGVK